MSHRSWKLTCSQKEHIKKQLLGTELNMQDIADLNGLNRSTLQYHARKLYRKAGVPNRHHYRKSMGRTIKILEAMNATSSGYTNLSQD